MGNVNLYDKKYADQRWLAAHNAWNTNGGAGQQNQCKTITEMLNYGVRGFALDVHEYNGTLYLEHGKDNVATRNNWSAIRDEFNNWMILPENSREVITLLFESHLDGPTSATDTSSELHKLQDSLTGGHGVTGLTGYVPGRATQETAIATKTLEQLVNAPTPQRVFAFIEHEPTQSKQLGRNQDLFPVMEGYFGENDYGDGSLRPHAWVDLRPGSAERFRPTFMNHFGAAPSGNEWDRNSYKKIVEHAHAFMFRFDGHYPNFTSLDYINFNPGVEGEEGPITAIDFLRGRNDTKVQRSGFNPSFDDQQWHVDKKADICSILVSSNADEGITNIQLGLKRPGMHSIIAIEVLYHPQKGVFNIRCKHAGQTAYGPWLNHHPNPASHITKEYNTPNGIAGLHFWIEDEKGVVDVEFASNL